MDAKSIMALLMLGAAVGTEIEVRVEGDDEEAAFESVCALINNGFGELDA